jgi:hypothetical protein
LILPYFNYLILLGITPFKYGKDRNAFSY